MKTGVTHDTTPPVQAPRITSITRGASTNQVVLEWEAAADFESGIREFVIYRNETPIARIPEKPITNTGFAQYQGLSYHDTPVPNTPALRYIDTAPPVKGPSYYTVATINGSGLASPKSAAARSKE